MALENIAKSAINGLEKKMMGGISKESAEKGINAVKEEGEKIITELSNDVNGKSTVITNQNRTIQDLNQQLSTSQAADAYKTQQLESTKAELGTTKENLEKTTTKLNKAKATKTFVQEHSDGSQTVRKSNKNGARMTIEKDAQGRTASVEVEQLDGSVRKTEYNKADGTRRNTTTNTHGDKTYEYDLAGEAKPISEAPIAKIINKIEGQDALGRKTITEEFDNGEKTITHIPNEKSKTGGVEKLDKEGNIKEIIYNQKDRITHAKYNENSTEITTEFIGDSAIWGKTTKKIQKDVNGFEYISKYEKTKPDGYKETYNTELDNFGIPQEISGQIKFSEKDRQGRPHNLKETTYTFGLEPQNDFYGKRFEPYNKTMQTKTTNGETLDYNFAKGDYSTKKGKLLSITVTDAKGYKQQLDSDYKYFYNNYESSMVDNLDKGTNYTEPKNWFRRND